MSTRKIEKFVDQLFDKGLSGWHRKIICHALLDEYTFSSGKNYSEIQRVMKESFGESISVKTISELVGNKQYYDKRSDGKSGKRHDKTLKIVLKYLLNPEITGRLTEKHFIQEKLDHLAPSSLTEFFNPYWQDNEIIDSGYIGDYREFSPETNLNSPSTDLFITASSNRGYFSVTEIVIKKIYLVREKDYQTDRFPSIPMRESIGWGIPMPEDRLMVFMRDSDQCKNYIYMNLGKPIRNKNSIQISQMLLIQNRDPLLKKWNQLSKKSDSFEGSLNHNILHMRHIDDFSCSKDEKDDIDKEGEKENELGFSLASDTRFVDTQAMDSYQQENQINEKGNKIMDEEEQQSLNQKLVDSAYGLDIEGVTEALIAGADINYRDPESYATAIHFAASYGYEEMANVLLSPEWDNPCNLLFRDKQGRLPSGCAAQGSGKGNIMAFAERLMKIEKKQGEHANPAIAPRIDGDELLDQAPEP